MRYSVLWHLSTPDACVTMCRGTGPPQMHVLLCAVALVHPRRVCYHVPWHWTTPDACVIVCRGTGPPQMRVLLCAVAPVYPRCVCYHVL